MEIDLVLSGSGTRFPIFLGALKAFEENNVVIKRVAGTSGGGLIAACIALNIKPDDLFEMVLKTNFESFKDFSLLSLVRQYGLYKGDVIEKLAEQVTGGVTFNYSPMDCRIIACDPINSESVVFSKTTTPDVKISQAIRYSVSVPIVFGYKKYNGKPLVDGLLSSNYPIDIFDDNERKTIGLRLISSSKKTCCFNRLNIVEYVAYLVDSLIVAIENEHIDDAKNADTIAIDACRFNPMNFNITTEDKHNMFDLGYQTANAYFKGV